MVVKVLAAFALEVVEMDARVVVKVVVTPGAGMDVKGLAEMDVLQIVNEDAQMDVPIPVALSATKLVVVDVREVVQLDAPVVEAPALENALILAPTIAITAVEH